VTDNLSETFNLVVGEKENLVKGIETLIVDNDFGCGLREANPNKHRTHGNDGGHRESKENRCFKKRVSDQNSVRV
jgi:hypothetical protein